MKSYSMKQTDYLAILKVLTLTTIFTLLLIIIFLLSTKISAINNKKNNLLKYSTELNININDLHHNTINNNQINFDTIKKLKKLLATSIINTKKHNHQSIFFYNNDLTNIINNIDFLWKDILYDLNSLLDNEEKIYDLISVLEQLRELLMQTKADCKNLVEEMLVINVNANKISLAQQTIWIAERATNNIDNYIKDINMDLSNDNFTKDIKNLFNIINSLKNGNSLINTTKIEDKNVIQYLSKIDINLQKTIVLFKTIDDKLITFSHVKSISESIDQSIIKFNEYLINLNNFIINNESYNNIFMFIYSSLLVLIILTLLITIFALKSYFYKKNKEQSFDFNDNSYLATLVSEIESLSAGNLHIKLTPNNKLKPLITAINQYTDYIIKYINEIYNAFNAIANININIDKYKTLQIKCLESITTNVNKHRLNVEYIINSNKKIVNTVKPYAANTEELMLLIDKIPSMLDLIDSKTDNLKHHNNTIVNLINKINNNNSLTSEIYDSLEIFILNYEINSYNVDNKINEITIIKDKIKTLKQQNEIISATLVNINIDEYVTSIISDLKLNLNELLEYNKKLSQPHKLIKDILSTTIDKYTINNNEIILKNIELIDKAFSKLLSDKQKIRTTINNIETIIKYDIT